MRKFERGGEPDVLAENWAAWGLEWERRRNENSKAKFHWHTVNGQPLNQRLLPLLKSQTQNHCSFCDNFPVSPPSIETIEHFRPKSQFPRDAYRWSNLYFCCMHCQQKLDEFDEALLQPDAHDFDFDRYFRWDFTTGKIEVNTQASLVDQTRAAATIKIYRLNEGHPSLRKRELRRRSQGRTDPIDEFAYRGFVDAA